MDITEESKPARVIKKGYQHDVAVAAGKSLTIETSPQGVEILNTECPAGKAWTVYVYVQIEEVDA